MQVQDVNKLLKQHAEMVKMMKRVNKLGEKGFMLLPHVSQPVLLPAENFKDFTWPQVDGANHWHQWVDACRGKGETSADFAYAAALTEVVLLGNSAFSNYHAAQFSLNKRFSRGLQFNLAYTFSKAMDNASVDPGSTAGSGKPDLPNAGFTAQGNAFNTRANYAPSDFDRNHRFSASFVYDLPSFGSKSKLLTGWQVSGFLQNQSGTPFSVFSAEVVASSAANYASTRLASGGLYRLAFGRPSLCGTLDQLRQGGSDKTEQYFSPAALCSPLTAAGGYPNNLGFGNLGRNVLRAQRQNRFDAGLAKNTQFTERVGLEFRWEIFNLFNNVNFAAPENVIGDAGTDFNKITNTVGGPRVMQFGLKLKF